MEKKEVNIKYGLMAIDRREMEADENANPAVLHFCGYEKKPAQNEVNELYRELKEDKEFGLSDIFEHIDIYEAPESVVEHFKDTVKTIDNETTTTTTNSDTPN